MSKSQKKRASESSLQAGYLISPNGLVCGPGFFSGHDRYAFESMGYSYHEMAIGDALDMALKPMSLTELILIEQDLKEKKRPCDETLQKCRNKFPSLSIEKIHDHKIIPVDGDDIESYIVETSGGRTAAIFDTPQLPNGIVRKIGYGIASAYKAETELFTAFPNGSLRSLGIFAPKYAQNLPW